MTYCVSVFTTYIGIDFGMAYGERTVTVQKHAAVARALILLFLSTLRVSDVGLFIASVNTDSDLETPTLRLSAAMDPIFMYKLEVSQNYVCY